MLKHLGMLGLALGGIIVVACSDAPTNPVPDVVTRGPTFLAYACPTGWTGSGSTYTCDGGIVECDLSSAAVAAGCSAGDIELCSDQDPLLGCGWGYDPRVCYAYSVLTGTCSTGGNSGTGTGTGTGTPQLPPSDSVSYEEMVALTTELTNDMEQMAALWNDEGVSADVGLPSSAAHSGYVVTPETVLDLLLLLWDVGEMVVAGPTADNVSAVATDLAFALIPGVPNVAAVRKLSAGAKASRQERDRLLSLLSAARAGVRKHREFHLAQVARGQVGARRITQIKNGVPKIGFIDGADIDWTLSPCVTREGYCRKFTIIELKPSGQASLDLGLAQLRRYRDGLLYQGSFRHGNQTINFTDEWEILTRVEQYVAQ